MEWWGLGTLLVGATLLFLSVYHWQPKKLATFGKAGIIALTALVIIGLMLSIVTLYPIVLSSQPGGSNTSSGNSALTPQASIQINQVASSPPIYQIYVVQFNGNISLNKVDLFLKSTNGKNYTTLLGDDLNSVMNVGNLWNVTALGSSYLSKSTVIEISGKTPILGDQNISEIKLIDISTKGSIVSANF